MNKRVCNLEIDSADKTLGILQVKDGKGLQNFKWSSFLTCDSVYKHEKDVSLRYFCSSFISINKSLMGMCTKKHKNCKPTHFCVLFIFTIFAFF